LAVTVASLALGGNKIVDVKMAAVDQILLNAKSRQREGQILAPKTRQPISAFFLPSPALGELGFGSEMRAKQANDRKTGGGIARGIGVAKLGALRHAALAGARPGIGGVKRKLTAIRFQTLIAPMAAVRKASSALVNCSLAD